MLTAYQSTQMEELTQQDVGTNANPPKNPRRPPKKGM